MKIFQGETIGLVTPFVARVDCVKRDERGTSYLLSGKNRSAIVRTGTPVFGLNTAGGWYRFENIDIFNGDIVIIQSNGQLHVVFSSDSTENSLFLTDRCNHRCVMCAQSRSEVSNVYYKEAREIVELMEIQPVAWGLTGGEPLLYKDLFLEFILSASNHIPETQFQLLTNGTMLSDFDYAKKIHKINPNISYCIPLYAHNEIDHNKIVGNNQAFWKTMSGLYNIGNFQSKIEIRTVLFSQTIESIVKLAEFICNNIPFASHVAIMGIEMIGDASKHPEFYIFNSDYSSLLNEIADIFLLSNMNFSFYNIPLCLTPKSLHKFCCQSISQWKVRYVDKCKMCSLREQCCGIFFSNVEYYEKSIPR